MFDVKTKEYNRQIKNGRNPDHFFCSLSCSTSWGNVNTDRSKKMTEPKLAHLSKLSNLCPNQKGNFTYYLNKCRHRNKTFNLTEEYLQFLWDQQEGRCPFTGYKMTLQTQKSKLTLYSASLDRSDSSLGYIQGNVQFVCYFVNMGKNRFSVLETHNFLQNMDFVKST